LKPLPPTDALEYAIDAPEEYEAIVYGDNSDILPDSYDETGDEERYSAYEDYIENKLSSNVGQQKK
jgi:hypothetical protein